MVEAAQGRLIACTRGQTKRRDFAGLRSLDWLSIKEALSRLDTKERGFVDTIVTGSLRPLCDRTKHSQPTPCRCGQDELRLEHRWLLKFNPFYRDSIENRQFGGHKSKCSRGDFRGHSPPLLRSVHFDPPIPVSDLAFTVPTSFCNGSQRAFFPDGARVSLARRGYARIVARRSAI